MAVVAAPSSRWIACSAAQEGRRRGPLNSVVRRHMNTGAANRLDEREAHRALGQFIVEFQWVEHLMGDVAALLLDGDRTARARTVLSKLNVRGLIDATEAMFTRFVQERSYADGDERVRAFHGLCERCRRLNNRRNELVHSTFSQLHNDSGFVALLRNKHKFRSGGGLGARVEHEEEEVTVPVLEQGAAECIELVEELERIRLWLIDEVFA